MKKNSRKRWRAGIRARYGRRYRRGVVRRMSRMRNRYRFSHR